MAHALASKVSYLDVFGLHHFEDRELDCARLVLVLLGALVGRLLSVASILLYL